MISQYKIFLLVFSNYFESPLLYYATHTIFMKSSMMINANKHNQIEWIQKQL